MQVVDTVTDKQVIKDFNELVHTKLHEAEQFPDAIQGWRCSAGHDTASFLLYGSTVVGKVVHDSEGHHRMVFADDREVRGPAYQLRINDEGELLVEYGGDDIPALEQQLELAKEMTVLMNELVPYGWVDGDLVSAVLVGREFTVETIDGKDIAMSGTDCFVLQGHRLPAELKMETSHPQEWMERVWQCIRTGSLVRLSDRVNSLEDKVFARGDGTDMGYIEFDGTDGQTPAFVVGKPYVYWHPRENYPGEIFKGWAGHVGPYNNTLAGWFR